MRQRKTEGKGQMASIPNERTWKTAAICSKNKESFACRKGNATKLKEGKCSWEDI